MFLNKINETLGGVTEGLEGLSGETEKVGDAVETGNNQVSPSAVEEGEKKKQVVDRGTELDQRCCKDHSDNLI